MRKFEFQVFDNSLNLVDRFPLDYVTDPSGLGFEQNVELVETKALDYIVDRALKKSAIRLTVHFQEPQSYVKIEQFRSWYSKYYKQKTVLKYSTGAQDKYMDIVITKFSVTEINVGMHSVPIELKPLSPFYLLKNKMILASILTVGKKYPFTYPYQYGGGYLQNNELVNDFFEPIPLTVRIMGPVANPVVGLKDSSDNIYAQVKFSTISLDDGQYIIIDAINQRITYYANASAPGVDYYNYVDKAFQTFLFANPGTSSIFANLSELEPSSNIQVNYVQFVL